MLINGVIPREDLLCFCVGTQPKPVESFFQDVQNTIDKEQVNLQILLLTARKLIYVDSDRLDREQLQFYLTFSYEQRIQGASYLFDCCETLNAAEKQQKAFERQLSINGKEASSILFFNEVPDCFFERLYDVKLRHGFHTPNLSREECIQGYRILYDKCRRQPIPAAMLPLVLTVFSTDGKLFRNLYAYFKYKNRRLSNDAQKQVFLLFEEISTMVAEQLINGKLCEIPVFHWTEIEDTFCQYRNLPSADIEVVKRYFSEYRRRNDLSKQDEAELMKFSYGNDVRSLAKLCNLNTYILMQSFGDVVPGKAKKPLQQLLDGKLLPTVNPSSKGKNYLLRYFYGLYKSIPCNPDFSYFALLRYYRLPLDLHLTAQPDFFSDIEGAIASATKQYKENLRCRYRVDCLLIKQGRGKEQDWLNGRLSARAHYKYQNIPERNKFIKHAKIFACQIVSKFAEDDYRRFINQSENFSVNYFPIFLRNFCEAYDISGYTDVSDQEACFVEDEAYVTILDLIQNKLLKNVTDFWRKVIGKELYLD